MKKNSNRNTIAYRPTETGHNEVNVDIPQAQSASVDLDYHLSPHIHGYMRAHLLCAPPRARYIYAFLKAESDDDHDHDQIVSSRLAFAEVAGPNTFLAAKTKP
jgi:hypothetical protein